MNQFEASIILWIQENLRGAMDGFWIFVTHLGDEGYLWIALGIVLLFWRRQGQSELRCCCHSSLTF